ncbi:MAG TPA: pyridoxal-phosphate dependent enzyme [Polyangiaceae bacterium]|nr:pyridoxal-phosphate dependent enzyme [Polyangiaceae bacterium]
MSASTWPGAPLDAAALAAARGALRRRVVETPVRRSFFLERALRRRRVWLKLEQQQQTGSFKLRGAFLALLATPRELTVFTASAGNHALAMAHAAAATGHRLVIYGPHTMSSVKRERLAIYPAAFRAAGTTLMEACQEAEAHARRSGGVFISPYEHPTVVLGQATVTSEVLEQIPQVSAVVVPTGGGGLAAGAAMAVAAEGRRVQVIACQAARAPSLSAAVNGAELPPAIHRPSLADGLLVHVDRGAATVEPCRHLGVHFVHVDEEEIAAGMVSLLHHESLAVEGAGAAAVAAALGGHLDALVEGDEIALLVTGGNVASARVAEALTWPFRRPKLLPLLGLVGRDVEDEPVLGGPPAAPARQGHPSAIASLARGVADHATAATAAARALEAYCVGEQLEVFPEEHAARRGLADLVSGLAEALRSRAADARTPPHALEGLSRTALQSAAALAEYGRWQSPSYAQSVAATFARLASQGSGSVNYTRYGSPEVAEVEDHLLDVLGFDPQHVGLLATSSGMAAYALIEAYLLRAALRPGDAVLLSPYIYFEAQEQLTSLPGVTLIQSDTYDVDDLLALTAERSPRVIFLDPLANDAGLRMIDVEGFLRRLSAASPKPCWVVVDGTMLSGALDPFVAVPPESPLTVLYWESGSKYLQLGLDLTLLGLVAAPRRLSPSLGRLRRNTGAALYPSAAAVLPRYPREVLASRMARMTRAAAAFCEALAGSDARRWVKPIFPGHASHPDHALAASKPHAGGVVVLRFEPPGMNNRDALHALLERVLHLAREHRVPLAHGVSFGFSTPRVCAAAAMAESAPAFLRLSVGDLSEEQARGLAELFRCAITGVGRTWERLRSADRESPPESHP